MLKRVLHQFVTGRIRQSEAFSSFALQLFAVSIEVNVNNFTIVFQ